MTAGASQVRTVHESVRERVSPEEWQVRVDLAACYRLVAHYGWDDLIFTHVSARVPGAQGHFLINPFGMMFHEMTASSLVKVDGDGNLVLAGEGHDINPAGFVIHGAVYDARPDVGCVIHLHTRDGIAVSTQKEGLLPLSQIALTVLGLVAYHDYEGIAVDMDERERLVRDLGDRNLMILRNHGTLACGGTVAEAFMRMFSLERACQIQVAALAGERELVLPSEEAQRTVARQVAERRAGRSEGPVPGRAWPALLRLVEAKDPNFRN